ncbi:glycosyltransferase [Chryseobacterium rhizoplanae]|uniref:glycosyltransferase n=1 Tax=Chryseobacterium rhizoplanae TaxID=1609531 RepID=UPI001CE35457|nr:glycosyltransferase [Chryseobacterium rhizoplanae]UCA61897.1 glycosyltransferase [Chryseobacterium rhizoplanae]
MKILHAITQAELGGAQSVLISICNKAVQEGNEVYVVSAAQGPMWNLLDERIKKIKINNLHREIKPFLDINVLFQLKEINKSIKPDIIHLHSSKMGVIGRIVFPKNKIVYTVHGFDSVRVANRKFLIFEKLLKNRAKALVAVSNYDKEMLQLEGIKDNVQMIYNGIEDCRLNSIQFNSEKINKLKSISEKHIVIMTIARLSLQKKFDLFCEIAERYMDDDRFRFVWIGNKDSDKVEHSSNVIMLGEVDQASNLLAYADIFILPSNYEGLPVSILEALCFAKPVVASNVGGIPEILNTFNGYASENTVGDFKGYIDNIMMNEEKYQSYSNSARKTFEKDFTVDEMYGRYWGLYEQIFNNNN